MHCAPWALSTQVAPGAHRTLAQVRRGELVVLGAGLGMLPGVDAPGVDGGVSGLIGGGAGS